MTAKQRDALALLVRSRQSEPTTDDGFTTSEATWYDVEVDVARVHWLTAAALCTLGLIEFGDYDPEGIQITLTSAAVPESSE